MIYPTNSSLKYFKLHFLGGILQYFCRYLEDICQRVYFSCVAYLLKARNVEPEKQPLLDNARTQQQRN
jgi:hypothetical protein